MKEWRSTGEAVANVMLPPTSASMTGLAVDQWWSGEAYPWRGLTNLHVLANGTLTAVGYRDEILRPIAPTYAGAVGPGFLLVQDNARPHVVRVCRQFLMPLTVFRRPESHWEPLGRSVSVHPPRWSSATDCTGAHRCPDPGLGGDPPGHHPPSHQEHAQTYINEDFLLFNDILFIVHILFSVPLIVLSYVVSLEPCIVFFGQVWIFHSQSCIANNSPSPTLSQLSAGTAQCHVLPGVPGSTVCGCGADPGLETFLHQGQSHSGRQVHGHLM